MAAGETAELLRPLTALPEIPSSLSSNLMAAHKKQMTQDTLVKSKQWQQGGKKIKEKIRHMYLIT